VEGVAAGGASSEGSGSVEPFPGEGAMEGSLAMAPSSSGLPSQGGKAIQRVFVVEAGSARGGTGLWVTRVEELEGGDAKRACKGGPSTLSNPHPSLPGFCQLKGPCIFTQIGCDNNNPRRSMGWFLNVDSRGLITCQEVFDDGCNSGFCEGSQYGSKEACEVECLGFGSPPGPSGGGLMRKLNAVYALAWTAGMCLAFCACVWSFM
jgi:hypothetical protein